MFFLSVQIVYAILTLVLWMSWSRTPIFHELGLVAGTKLSVITVVRDEEDNIGMLLETIAAQTYPKHQFEVLVVNDFSTDATAAIVRDFAGKAGFALRLLELKDHLGHALPEGNYKKKAIEWAVSQADGELMVTTDGDCQVPENWLAVVAAFHRHTRAQMICGGVTFLANPSSFARWQTVEFASLIGSGAATLRLGLPTLCNAANLAFTKQAFLEVGGYQDTASTATGDDLFLMHKMYRRYPEKVLFLKSPHSVVRTSPQATLAGFYQQRKRWASKWSLYKDKRVSWLAAFVFIANLLAVIGLLGVVFGKMSPTVFLAGVAIRWLVEWGFLSAVLCHLGKRGFIRWIPVVQWTYPFYVVFFGLAAQKKGYRWKGRDLH